MDVDPGYEKMNSEEDYKGIYCKAKISFQIVVSNFLKKRNGI